MGSSRNGKPGTGTPGENRETHLRGGTDARKKWTPTQIRLKLASLSGHF
jgi:hypothetical protein